MFSELIKVVTAFSKKWVSTQMWVLLIASVIKIDNDDCSGYYDDHDSDNDDEKSYLMTRLLCYFWN